MCKKNKNEKQQWPASQCRVLPDYSDACEGSFFGHTSTIVAPHQPCSLDLASCYFLLFPKMKVKLKRYCCDTVVEIQRLLQMVLDTLERDFQGMFQAWQEYWEQCRAVQGDYFEGDSGQISIRYGFCSLPCCQHQWCPPTLRQVATGSGSVSINQKFKYK